MDDVIEFVIEVLGELLEAILGNIKNPQKRKWALTVFYSAILTGITIVFTLFAVESWKDDNATGAIIMGVITGVLFLVLGFFVVRGHRQSWKKQ